MTSETITKYGLRHRENGRLVRMEKSENPYAGDYGSPYRYSLSLTHGDDFLVDSADELATFLMYDPRDTRGDMEDMPRWESIEPSAVEPVKVEIIRTISAVDLQLPIQINSAEIVDNRDYPPIMVRRHVEVRKGVRYNRLITRRSLDDMQTHLGKTVYLGWLLRRGRIEAVLEVPEDEADLVENGSVVLVAIE